MHDTSVMHSRSLKASTVEYNQPVVQPTKIGQAHAAVAITPRAVAWTETRANVI